MVLITDEQNNYANTISFNEFKKGILKYQNENMFIVLNSSIYHTLNLISYIKKQELPILFLKPIVLYTPNSINEDLYLQKTIDLTIATFNDDVAKNLNNDKNLATINSRVQKIIQKKTKDDEENIETKILRFLYTRAKNLEPYASTNTVFGYSYPIIDGFFHDKDPFIFSVLKTLEHEKVLLGKFVEYNNKCPKCEAGFINYKETCPDCHSSDLESDELVHHFECANMAPKHEYLQPNGELICKKCNKKLKQIAQDYDIPSMIYLCHSCLKEFQEPYIYAQCYQCQYSDDANYFTSREIKSYELTSLTQDAAILGMDKMFFQKFSQNLDVLTYDLFKKFLTIEHSRTIRYTKSDTSIAIYNLNNLTNIYTSTDVKDIFEQLGEIIFSHLRTSDVISILNKRTFLMMLVETPYSHTNIVLSRLDKSIKELFKESLNIDIDSDYKAIEINEEFSIELLEQHINGNIVSEK
ncbi:MAG: hypothetical protein U9P38_02365 [Campylobacterota bacterium]|nr:hypothetical protein [Campylobacterota bacterium]